jgi:hypothetical protein
VAALQPIGQHSQAVVLYAVAAAGARSAPREESNDAPAPRASDDSMIEPGAERLAALSSQAELLEKVGWLRELGPRETGNPEHVRFVSRIADELASLGLQVRRDSHSFDRWSVPSSGSRCALTVLNAAGGDLTIPVASAYPYSGRTGPLGVSGPLQLVRSASWWNCVAGKIAVIQVPHPSVPVKLLLDDVGHLPADASGFPDVYRHPVLSAKAFGPDLAAAKAAGAIGVVAVWQEATAAQVADQYVPFDFPYRDIPAVWVAGENGEQLLDSARRGARATLTLDATLSPGSTTDTVWTVVEGEIANESILVVTHTDGGNAVEENGALGVLELVRLFATGPRPKRTLVFVFVTAHLRIPAVTDRGQAMTAWLTAHPEWWSGEDRAVRAVAGLVLEHLGALVRARRSSGEPVEPEVELTYATNAAMQEVLKKSWTGRQRGKALIARPTLFHLGEGEPLYQQGIPAIALASVPVYLLEATTADIVDVELMHEQIGTFARALLALESMPAHLLGRADRVGLVNKILTGAQVLLVIARVRWLAWLSAFQR